MKISPWANYNNMKAAAFKLLVGLDHDGMIPAFAVVTQGKVMDMMQAHLFEFQKGSVVVFDKGCNCYAWHNNLTDRNIFYVTRIRGNAKYQIFERRKVIADDGVTNDQIIEYTSVRSRKKSLYPVRRIGYRDPEIGKHYVFITNQFAWPPKTIAAIYKQRWQVELFFKWIKQSLKIKAFLGTSENAVMTQIMVALCIYLLLAYLKFQSRISISLQQISRLILLNLFIRRSLSVLLQKSCESISPPPQLRLAQVRY